MHDTSLGRYGTGTLHLRKGPVEGASNLSPLHQCRPAVPKHGLRAPQSCRDQSYTPPVQLISRVTIVDIIVVALQLGLAAILTIAGVGKMMDLPGSRKAVRNFGVPRRYADPLGTALPFGELLLAALLLFGVTARLAALGALLVFVVFIAGIAWNLRHGRQPDCHCFGELHSSPAGWHTVVRNTAFALMAAIVVVAGARGPLVTVAELSTIGQVGLWLTVLILAVGAAQVWFLNRIRAQQELLRGEIDALQVASLFSDLGSRSTAVSPVAPAREDPVGEPALELDLPTLDGGRLTLDELRASNTPVLLLFTTPDCVFCSAMYPEVQEWTRRFGRDLTVAVIGRGDIEANREKLAGFDLPFVAVDKSGDTATTWDAVATPTGIIVQPNGTIVDEVARGRPAIQKLVGRTLQRRQQQQTPAVPSLVAAESRPIESWPAPSFELPTPDGGTLSMESLLSRGKPVLVIFWSTSCGFCDQLGPEAGEWIRRFSDDVTFAFISIGSAETNRDHIERFGLINVGLQERAEIMQSMGGSGTPSAVLIRPDGFIQDDVAVGAPEIRKLLGRALTKHVAPVAASPPVALPLARGEGAGTKGVTETSENGASSEEDEIRALLMASANTREPELGTPGSRLPWADLDGGFVGLDDYLGNELVLVFWSVDCEFSQRLLSDLREWEQEAGEAVSRTLIISAGDIDRNRQQRLRSRVVLDDAFTTASSYGASGTPAAIRLDRNGRVASSLAVGSDAVMDLLYDFSESEASSSATTR